MSSQPLDPRTLYTSPAHRTPACPVLSFSAAAGCSRQQSPAPSLTEVRARSPLPSILRARLSDLGGLQLFPLCVTLIPRVIDCHCWWRLFFFWRFPVLSPHVADFEPISIFGNLQLNHNAIVWFVLLKSQDKQLFDNTSFIIDSFISLGSYFDSGEKRIYLKKVVGKNFQKYHQLACVLFYKWINWWPLGGKANAN